MEGFWKPHDQSSHLTARDLTRRFGIPHENESNLHLTSRGATNFTSDQKFKHPCTSRTDLKIRSTLIDTNYQPPTWKFRQTYSRHHPIERPITGSHSLRFTYLPTIFYSSHSQQAHIGIYMVSGIASFLLFSLQNFFLGRNFLLYLPHSQAGFGCKDGTFRELELCQEDVLQKNRILQ